MISHTTDFPLDAAPPTRLKKLTAWTLIVAMIGQPITAAGQGVIVDPNAGAHKPVVGATLSGVPLVQITAPSAAGVSRNQYSQFNVDPQGLILNNALTLTLTQLGGYVEGNANLSNGAARLILNEVTGVGASSLRGFIEVAGSKADVVIANPNGITCNGCGFINTSRGVLTTGTPIFGGSGSLDAFRVSGGLVTVEGAGLNALGADRVDILSRAVSVNAGIWAKELNVVTGANQINYATLGTQTIAGVGVQPAVALDVAALGGMYAGKITLVGTEAGVGVNQQGSIAATGDFIVTQTGQILLAGITSTNGAMTLTTQASLSNTGVTTSGSHLSLNVQNISNSGTLAAGVDEQGQSQGAANLTVQATAALTGNGVFQASDSQQLSAASIDLTQAEIQANGDISMSAQSGNLILNGAQLASGGHTNLSASQALDTRNASVIAGGQLALNAQQIDNRQGLLGGVAGVVVSANSLNNQQGTILSGTDLTLNVSGALDNTLGIVAADRTITLVAPTLTNTTGTINAGHHLNITSDTTHNSAGLLRAGLDLTHTQTTSGSSGAAGTQEAGNDALITSNGSLTVLAGESLYAGNNLTVQAAGSVANSGALEAFNQLNLSAAQIDNSASIIGHDVTLTATTMNNIGATALIGATNDLTLNASNVTNQDDATLYASNDLKIQGDTSGNPGNSLTNSSALIEAGRDVSVNMNQITNQRTSVVIQAVPYAPSINLYYKAYGDVWPAAPYLGDTYYLMYSPLISYERERWVDVTFTQDQLSSATAAGQIQAGRNMTVTAQNLSNSNSIMAAAGLLNANVSGVLSNTGQTFYATQNILTHHMACIHYPSHNCQGGRSDVYTTDTSNNVSGGMSATLQGAQAVTINTGSLNLANSNARGIVAPSAGGSLSSSALPSIQVPTGGLFAQNANPASRYLIETDPRFANRANFISSDYFLQRLGINFDAFGKRAGDAFVEARLVREQLFELTGRRFLAGYQSDNDQLLALYDAGVRIAREMQLQPGIALTAIQVAALTSDMIWMQTETLVLADGSQHEVLVPRVYLARVKQRELNPNGSLIAGGDVAIYAANDGNVQGQIVAERGLALGAANYLQRAGKLQAKTIDLTALQNIKIQGGKLAARDINLSAGNNLEITRTATGEIVKSSLTQILEDAPTLDASGNATLIAGQNIKLAGAKISAGEQLALVAGNDLEIGAAARSENWNQHSGDGKYQRQAVFYSGSELNSGGDTILLANNDIKLIGSTLDSGNNLAAQGKNIVLLASVDQVAVQYSGGVSGKTKGSFASGNSSDERVSVSRLSAQGSIDLRAGTNPDPIDFDKLPPTAAGNIYSQGAQIKAGQDINLQGAQIVLDAVTENRSSQSSYSNTGGGVRQYQRQAESSTATGGIIDAGNNLTIKSSGDTTVVGSALNAGASANIKTGGSASASPRGKLALLAATSQSSEQISDYKQGRKKATTLNYSDNEVRQLLSTITVGNSVSLNVGGDFNADVGTLDANGKLQADRMTVNGIEKGESRQQISITRTGKAGGDSSTSEVRGKLSAQGIRANANDSFAPGATIQGQAAIEQYLASGLIQVKNNPQIQATLTAPTANGASLTYQDPSGKLQLSVAGQARAQEVYNQLKLTETFDVKKFADAQTAQIATLVAAVALTVMSGGAGASLIGAAAGSMSAAVANAAFIGMVSTMTGQLVAGASFGDAFAAGIKSGAISAVSAGLTYGVNDALGLNAQIDATTGKVVTDSNGVIQFGNKAATAYNQLGALDKLGNSLFWQQAGLNATAQGALSALQGGRFQDSFMASAASSVGSNFNKAVGDWAQQNGFTAGDFSKILLHAGIGAAQAGLTKQNIVAGAIGGATAELLSPLSDSLDATTGNKLAGELLTIGGAMAANQLLNGNADFASNLAAANQGLQTDRFNRQLHRDEARILSQLKKDKNAEARQRLDDAACALARCAAGIPDADPKKAELLAMQARGQTYTAELAQLASSGLFQYSTRDAVNDALLRNDESIQRTAGGVKLVSGSVGAVGGVAIAGAGAAGCAPSLGVSCLAVPAGAALTALSYGEARDGSNQLFGSYQSQEGQRVLDSFNIDTYPGERDRMLELGIDGAKAAIILATTKFGGNLLAKAEAALVEKGAAAGKKLEQVADDIAQQALLKSGGVVDKSGQPILDLKQLSTQQKAGMGELFGENTVKQIVPDGQKIARVPGVGETGIDDLYKVNRKDVDYVVIEYKFDTSKQGITKDGLQGSDSWLRGDVTGYDRISESVGREQAAEVAVALRNDRIEKWLVRTLPDGSTEIKVLDAAGKSKPIDTSKILLLGKTVNGARP